METEHNKSSQVINEIILYLYDHLYSPILYKIFKKIEIDSFNIVIDHKSISFPLASPEKLVFNNIKNKKVLDIGTGCGIIALCAKKKDASYILGTDINPKAVSNAKNNLMLNFDDTSNINFKVSDLFKEVHEKFDLIISHPPYFNNQPKSINEYKHSGKNIIECILRDGKKHLYKNGEIRILYPASEIKRIKDCSIRYGYNLKIAYHRLNKELKIELLRILFQLFYRPKVNIFIFKKRL